MQGKTKKHEKDYTEAIGNEVETSKYLNKVLKTRAKNAIGTLKKSNGEHTAPEAETLQELGDQQYPTHTEKRETVYPKPQITKQELETRYNGWITDEKVITAGPGGI